jgi:hypothetical protein
MRWFLIYYTVAGNRHDFACVRGGNRREAYHEVTGPLHEAASELYGPNHCLLWDSEDDIREPHRP